MLAGIAAAVGAWAAIGPLGAATIDPDASASVLYFERLAAGRQLEAFVPTTPKPALTLLYGVAWTILHDWRALVLLTIAAQAVAVALACLLVGRAVVAWAEGGTTWTMGAGLAARVATGLPARSALPAAMGAIAGGGLIAAALAGSPELLLEVAHANSLVWALAAWFAAGIALTVAQPRYGAAGLALMVGALLRVETWLLIGPAIAAGTWIAWRGRRRGGRRSPLADPALRLCVASLALPIGVLHDALLTGDPLFSFGVSARYTAIYVPGLRPDGPLEFLGAALPRWGGQPLLLVLALAGIVVALSTARRWIAGGILALTLGDLALLAVLAGRGTYVSARYYEVADMALLVAAGIGAGGIVACAAGAIVGRRGTAGVPGTRGHAPGVFGFRAAALAAAALGIGAGLALTWPVAAADRTTSSRLALVRQASEDVPAIEDVLRGEPTRSAAGAASAGHGGPFAMDPARAAWLVPSELRSRIAVDLDRPLTEVADSLAAFLASPPAAAVRDGQIVVHDRSADPGGTRYRPLYAPFETGTDAAGATGPLAGRLTPLLADATRGVWIFRVGPAR